MQRLGFRDLEKKIALVTGNNARDFTIPFFDPHFGNAHCDEKAAKKFLKESDKNTYIICGGDLADAIVTKDIRYRKASDATAGDDIVDEQVDKLESIL